MLIDIFARRYEATELRDSLERRDIRLLVQAFRILSEDLFPYFTDGDKNDYHADIWADLHSKLSRELGLTEFAPAWRGGYKKTTPEIFEEWMTAPNVLFADEHVKDRLSLIELGFRVREEAIRAKHAKPMDFYERQWVALTQKPPDGKSVEEWLHAEVMKNRAAALASFRLSVDELNTRFRQAGYPLNYHNGFIQISTDDVVQREVETPFWTLISDPLWQNVDLDMKEALDRRDSHGSDPAFYAARALESTIKIISDQKQWTHGGEKGAHNYIDNLAAKKNGLITQWEGNLLKEFFTHVRNPFSHGAGSEKIPALTRTQIEWAIEFSMSWIKALIRRM